MSIPTSITIQTVNKPCFINMQGGGGGMGRDQMVPELLGSLLNGKLLATSLTLLAVQHLFLTATVA